MTGKGIPFDFAKDYLLEDKYVQLSPLKENHIEPLSEISNNKDIWKYFFEKGDDFQKLNSYVLSAIDNRKSGKEYPFVVFDKKSRQYAGTTRFYEYSKDLKAIKLGYTWYGKSFQGTGLNKHTKFLLFQFAFENVGVERIGFGAFIDNIVSVAAMKSVGCKKEGILRSMFPSVNGKGRTDAILMSILKEEWQTSVKAQLISKLKT